MIESMGTAFQAFRDGLTYLQKRFLEMHGLVAWQIWEGLYPVHLEGAVSEVFKRNGQKA